MCVTNIYMPARLPTRQIFILMILRLSIRKVHVDKEAQLCADLRDSHSDSVA